MFLKSKNIITRKALLTLMVITCVSLISTVLLNTNVVQRYFVIDSVYLQRCESSLNDIFTTRLLPEATEYLSKRDNRRSAFFFVETSCSGNVSARQACAVESAAKLHPESDVYLLILSPPSSLDIELNPSLNLIIKKYLNIHVLYVHLETYFKNSVLEEWYRNGILQSSSYLQSHTSDVFRYFTLWKYGGTYLDLDIVLIKSLKNLKNFAGAESYQDIAAGVMNFEPSKGKLAYECLMEIKNNFKGDDWGYNGPGVITRVIQKLCNTKDTREMTKNKCKRLYSVMPPSAFYPIPWRKWKLYFDDSKSESTMNLLNNSYAIHVWNKFSITKVITVGSKQPYGLIADKFCPLTYHNSGLLF